MDYPRMPGAFSSSPSLVRPRSPESEAHERSVRPRLSMHSNSLADANSLTNAFFSTRMPDRSVSREPESIKIKQEPDAVNSSKRGPPEVCSLQALLLLPRTETAPRTCSAVCTVRGCWSAQRTSYNFLILPSVSELHDFTFVLHLVDSRVKPNAFIETFFIATTQTVHTLIRTPEQVDLAKVEMHRSLCHLIVDEPTHELYPQNVQTVSII